MHFCPIAQFAAPSAGRPVAAALSGLALLAALALPVQAAPRQTIAFVYPGLPDLTMRIEDLEQSEVILDKTGERALRLTLKPETVIRWSRFAVSTARARASATAGMHPGMVYPPSPQVVLHVCNGTAHFKVIVTDPQSAPPFQVTMAELGPGVAEWIDGLLKGQRGCDEQLLSDLIPAGPIASGARRGV